MRSKCWKCEIKQEFSEKADVLSAIWINRYPDVAGIDKQEKFAFLNYITGNTNSQ